MWQCVSCRSADVTANESVGQNLGAAVSQEVVSFGFCSLNTIFQPVPMSRIFAVFLLGSCAAAATSARQLSETVMCPNWCGNGEKPWSQRCTGQDNGCFSCAECAAYQGPSPRAAAFSCADASQAKGHPDQDTFTDHCSDSVAAGAGYVLLSFRWKDQGNGFRKGRVRLTLTHGGLDYEYDPTGCNGPNQPVGSYS